MKFLDAGLKLIKEFEGYAGTAYQDQGGRWTVGFGSAGVDIVKDLTWTQEQAEERLLQDISLVCKEVDALLKQPLSDSEYSALVCFTYNVGSGNLAKSTLLNCINLLHKDQAASEFLRWDKINGVPNPGLLRRRQAEKALFQAA